MYFFVLNLSLHNYIIVSLPSKVCRTRAEAGQVEGGGGGGDGPLDVGLRIRVKIIRIQFRPPIKNGSG